MHGVAQTCHMRRRIGRRYAMHAHGRVLPHHYIVLLLGQATESLEWQCATLSGLPCFVLGLHPLVPMNRLPVLGDIFRGRETLLELCPTLLQQT